MKSTQTANKKIKEIHKVKSFDEYVFENFTDNYFYDDKLEKKLVQAAMYHLAKRSGIFLNYFMTDRKNVKIIISSNANSRGTVQLKNYLKSIDVPFVETTSGASHIILVDVKKLATLGRDYLPASDI